ncbi:hypothetical protein [Deinococcus sp. QL22]|uniref:hypothetical protein n=1 Tax=Deinococcus sp. QL22 TaxID=2939437 RepID=UPI0020181B02|nr:hypothetical protein [Deinococcus sp. QL22]UQN08029.1 hypothetical protein M1R55_18225 [Deinococcus sp. QL22]
MPWKPVALNNLKKGDTVRLEGGATIRIRRVIGQRGSVLDVINDEGLPVEIRDTEAVVRLEDK